MLLNAFITFEKSGEFFTSVDGSGCKCSTTLRELLAFSLFSFLEQTVLVFIMRRKWKAAKAGRRRGRWCVGSSGFQPLCVWGRGRKFGTNKWCERKRGTVQRCCWCRWANSALEQATCQPFRNQPLMIFGPRDTCWSLYLKKQLQSFVGFSSLLLDEKPRGCVMSDTWLASESAKQFWRLSRVFVCECESVCVCPLVSVVSWGPECIFHQLCEDTSLKWGTLL